jgi:hypothetical protein
MANSYISLAAFKAAASASRTLKRAHGWKKDLTPSYTREHILNEVREKAATYKAVKASPEVIRQRAAERIVRADARRNARLKDEAEWQAKIRAGRELCKKTSK